MERAVVFVAMLTLLCGLNFSVDAVELDITSDYLYGQYHTENLGGLQAQARGPILRVDFRCEKSYGNRFELAVASITDAKMEGVPLVDTARGTMTRWSFVGTNSILVNRGEVTSWAGWTVVEFNFTNDITTEVPNADRYHRQFGVTIGAEARYPMGKRFMLEGRLGYRPWMRVESTNGIGRGHGVDFRGTVEYEVLDGLVVQVGYTSAQNRWTRDSDSSEHEQCVYGPFIGVRAIF